MQAACFRPAKGRWTIMCMCMIELCTISPKAGAGWMGGMGQQPSTQARKANGVYMYDRQKRPAGGKGSGWGGVEFFFLSFTLGCIFFLFASSLLFSQARGRGGNGNEMIWMDGWWLGSEGGEREIGEARGGIGPCGAGRGAATGRHDFLFFSLRLFSIYGGLFVCLRCFCWLAVVVAIVVQMLLLLLLRLLLRTTGRLTDRTRPLCTRYAFNTLFSSTWLLYTHATWYTRSYCAETRGCGMWQGRL